MDQVIQIIGALLVLAGFVAAQLRVWTTEWSVVAKLRGTDAAASAS